MWEDWFFIDVAFNLGRRNKKLEMRKIAVIIQILASLLIMALGIVDFIGFIDSNYKFTLDIVAILTILAGVLLLIGSINILTKKASGKILTILGWIYLPAYLSGLLRHFIYD